MIRLAMGAIATQRFSAGQDANGNPRRRFIVYGKDGEILLSIDTAQENPPTWTNGLPDLGEVRVDTLRALRELDRAKDAADRRRGIVR